MIGNIDLTYWLPSFKKLNILFSVSTNLLCFIYFKAPSQDKTDDGMYSLCKYRFKKHPRIMHKYYYYFPEVTFFLWPTWITMSVHSCLPHVKLLPLLQYSNIPLKWKQRQANYQHYFQTKSLLSVSSMDSNQRTRLLEMRWLREEAGTGRLDSDKW